MTHTTTHNSPAKRITLYRENNRRKGMTRLEVTVPLHDAGLVRRAAQTLRQGGRPASRLRGQLAESGDSGTARTPQELLAFFQNSPLATYDIDLTRDKSPIPAVEF